MPRKYARPGRDASGIYEAACRDIAESGGWRFKEVWGIWTELALMREYETKALQPLAEWLALEDIKAVFQKQGQHGN